jgi:flagellin
MSVDFNILSTLVALSSVQQSQSAVLRANQQLATGERINSAVDDPAGLIASVSMQATLAALDAETQTNPRAVVVTTIADGAMGQVSDLLDQAKGLVEANANTSGLSDDERAANQTEIDAILSSVDRLASTTQFAGKPLLDGTATVAASGSELTLGSVKTTDLGQVTVDSTSYTLADLRSGGALDTTSPDSATSLQVIDAAIENVATLRGQAGAFLSDDVEPRLGQLATDQEELTSTVSMIEDVDTAQAVSEATRAQIIAQSSQSMLGYELMRQGQTTSLLRGVQLDVRA